MILDFFEGKKVLVTGHTGFKGTWLSKWLLSLGAEVCGFSLAPTEFQEPFHNTLRSKGLHSIIGDLRDPEHLSNVVMDCRPDIVFHLAAQPLVLQSYAEPRQTFETNLIGTLNLFEALRTLDHSVCVVNITTDKVYANKERVRPYRELDLLGGYDPYSTSKACVELLTDCYRNSYFCKQDIKIASARAGNVLGGGDYTPGRLVPDIIKSLKDRGELILRNPSSIRPGQHVLDALYGYMLVAKGLLHGANQIESAWNFAPTKGLGITVEQIARAIFEIHGRGSIRIEEQDLHEANLLLLDATKAKLELGWIPKIGGSSIVDWTCEWYAAAEKGEMNEITQIQLDRFNMLIREDKNSVS